MGVGLLLAALAVGVAGPVYLRHAVDAGSRPRGALGAWLGTGLVFVLLLIAAPVVMHLRPLRGFAPAAAAVSACTGVFDGGAGLTWLVMLRGTVVAAALTVVVLAVVVVAAAVLRSRRADHTHLRSLRSLVEETDRVDGVAVWWIADDEPVAYSLRGSVAGGRGVVIASTALQDLPSDRRDAVIGHEIAHVRGRHHVTVEASRSLRSALRAVPLLRRAAAEVAVLVELLADRRAATERGGVAAVRGALVEFGAPAGRVAVLRPGPGRGHELGYAMVHAVSPALAVAVVSTVVFLASCPLIAV